jgi:thiosulfate/3-mercaptopyruvate sulfurtransferase
MDAVTRGAPDRVQRHDDQRGEDREKDWSHGGAQQYGRRRAIFQAEQTANHMFTTLISTAALDANRHHSWAIVDCRFDLQQPDWGRDQYRLAHIPSAVYAHLAHDLSSPMTGTNGRHPWPSSVAMATTFGSIGIDADTQVVVYDQDIGIFAARLWWMLRSQGHDAVAVLDGGWTKWIREGRPSETGDESRTPTTFVSHPRPGLIADLETVIASADALLVDARSPERFAGKGETLDRVGGHIPGAVNRFYKQNVGAEGTFRDAATLRAEFEEVFAGRPPDHTIMYCGSGVTACHNLLALEHAGLSGARLYPGSWSEWSADPQRPIER